MTKNDKNIFSKKFWKKSFMCQSKLLCAKEDKGKPKAPLGLHT